MELWRQLECDISLTWLRLRTKKYEYNEHIITMIALKGPRLATILDAGWGENEVHAKVAVREWITTTQYKTGWSTRAMFTDVFKMPV